MRYSKERLFKSCNIGKHCIATHLTHPIIIDRQTIYTIYIKSLVLSDSERLTLYSNIANGINTIEGEIVVSCFIDGGNPVEPIQLSISLDNINEIESIEQC